MSNLFILLFRMAKWEALREKGGIAVEDHDNLDSGAQFTLEIGIALQSLTNFILHHLLKERMVLVHLTEGHIQEVVEVTPAVLVEAVVTEEEPIIRHHLLHQTKPARSNLGYLLHHLLRNISQV